jgi:hypothetical protein
MTGPEMTLEAGVSRSARAHGSEEPWSRSVVTGRRPTPRLFHFSEQHDIERFVPRPVLVPSERPVGMEWLNGPLVWAVEDARQGDYLFPRNCPRILLWLTSKTTANDKEQWWGASTACALAYVEQAWWNRLSSATIYRYDMPAKPFTRVDDEGGFWVSREVVAPSGVQSISDLPNALAEQNVEMRVVDRLTHLRGVWGWSFHASGIRLRNAKDW